MLKFAAGAVTAIVVMFLAQAFTIQNEPPGTMLPPVFVQEAEPSVSCELEVYTGRPVSTMFELSQECTDILVRFYAGPKDEVTPQEIHGCSASWMETGTDGVSFVEPVFSPGFSQVPPDCSRRTAVLFNPR